MKGRTKRSLESKKMSKDASKKAMRKILDAVGIKPSMSKELVQKHGVMEMKDLALLVSEKLGRSVVMGDTIERKGNVKLTYKEVMKLGAVFLQFIRDFVQSNYEYSAKMTIEFAEQHNLEEKGTEWKTRFQEEIEALLEEVCKTDLPYTEESFKKGMDPCFESLLPTGHYNQVKEARKLHFLAVHFSQSLEEYIDEFGMGRRYSKTENTETS